MNDHFLNGGPPGAISPHVVGDVAFFAYIKTFTYKVIC